MTSSFAAFASQMLHRPSPSADTDEPMFFSFTSGGGGRSMRLDEDDDEEDPHLHMRESDDPYGQYDESDDDDHSEGGWLAHQGSPLLPSPGPSTPSPPPPPPRMETRAHKPQQQHISLTASLLPQTSPHPVFSLPLVPARRPTAFNDFPYIAAYLACVTACMIACIALLFSKPPNRTDYKTLIQTIPLLTILTVLAAALSYGHLFVLKIFARPALLTSSLLVPVSLAICALWAFVGSFTYEGEPTWGESVGLRLFSLIPLVLSILAFRNLDQLPRDIHTTVSMLELIDRVLRANPLLLGVSPALLVGLWIASIPFVTILFRVDMIIGWGAIGAIGTWLWTWGVARGIMRVVVAGVVGSHYFNPRAGDTRPLHAAGHRATQTSLGSVIVASLILTIMRMLVLLSIGLGRLPIYTSVPFLVSFSRWAVRWLDSVTSSLSKFALTWVGLTGETFFNAARKSQSVSAETMKQKLARPPSLRLLLTTTATLPLPSFLILYLFVAHTLNAPNKALGIAIMGGAVTLLTAWMCVGLIRDIGDSLWMAWCIDQQQPTGSERRAMNAEWREDVTRAFEHRPSQQPATQPIRRFPPPPPEAQSTLPVYSPPRPPARQLRSPTPPPMQPRAQYAYSPPQQPRRLQSPPMHEPEPEPLNVDDLDPFDTEHTPMPSVMDESGQSRAYTESRGSSFTQSMRGPTQSSVLAAAQSSSSSSRLPGSDSESEEEDGGVFPGSGLFGSGGL